MSHDKAIPERLSQPLGYAAPGNFCASVSHIEFNALKQLYVVGLLFQQGVFGGDGVINRLAF